jgi:hypothetical protein
MRDIHRGRQTGEREGEEVREKGKEKERDGGGERK